VSDLFEASNAGILPPGELSGRLTNAVPEPIRVNFYNLRIIKKIECKYFLCSGMFKLCE